MNFSSNCAYLEATLRQPGTTEQCTPAQLEVKQESIGKSLILKKLILLSAALGGVECTFVEVNSAGVQEVLQPRVIARPEPVLMEGPKPTPMACYLPAGLTPMGSWVQKPAAGPSRLQKHVPGQCTVALH
ncbi:MAG TPA: hypothetical protein VI685_25450, partial [Candidatus Angelobacter sp.]